MEIIQPEYGLILWSLLVTGLLFFWILTIIRVAKSNYIDRRMKLVWGVLVFFLPVIGILLYYSLGRHQRINNH